MKEPVNDVVCQHCNSTELVSRGYEHTRTATKRRYVCKECNKGTYVIVDEFGEEEYEEDGNRAFTWDDKDVENLVGSHRGFVITSAQNDTETHQGFKTSLESYCKRNNYRLIVIPVRYMNPNAMRRPGYCEWDDDLRDYFVENEININNNLKVVGNINVQATAVNPISGLDHITNGKTTIIGHPQLQMSTVPVNKYLDPIILTTTGTISLPNIYSRERNIPKAGYKAQHFRSLSAIVVETDGADEFHMRQLMADEDGGFYDIDGYYAASGKFEPLTYVQALITGDEHHIFFDPKVMDATYLNQDSIANTLCPQQIVRHDVLDCYSVSHHHRRNKFRLYDKFQTGMGDLESELRLTYNQIAETSLEGVPNIIVESNHNEHLSRWLNECDPSKEPWNAKLFHELMYKCLDHIETTNKDPNPLQIWVESRDHDVDADLIFLERDEPYFIADILVSMHGDIGPNGARGSAKNLSKISESSVIGHSHSPAIEKNCWQVGISTYGTLEYNTGPSKWMNTHCVIYPNGTRQLINIINGKWRPSWKMNPSLSDQMIRESNAIWEEFDSQLISSVASIAQSDIDENAKKPISYSEFTWKNFRYPDSAERTRLKSLHDLSDQALTDEIEKITKKAYQDYLEWFNDNAK